MAGLDQHGAGVIAIPALEVVAVLVTVSLGECITSGRLTCDTAHEVAE